MKWTIPGWFRRPIPRRQRLKTAVCLILEELEDRLALSTTFAVIGDYGNDSSDEADVANLVASWNPDFIVTAGDNNYSDGSASSIDANIGQYYGNYIYPYVGDYGSTATVNRFFPALGNHDWNSSAGFNPYLNYFTLPGNERYYMLSWGEVDIFILNSDSHEPDGRTSTSVQAQWLQAQLEASSATWKIVVFHHSPYSSGATHGGTSEMRWPFDEWGATAVISAHDHDYERLLIDDFPYFVNGLGGAGKYTFSSSPVSGSQVRYDDDFGAMLVTADASQIHFQFINVDGVVIDDYTISLDVTPVVALAMPDGAASEAGADPATFRITRSGSTATSLVVNYTVSGAASNGGDYSFLDGNITIPAGRSSVDLTIAPVNDALSEGVENVTVTLATGSSYEIGSTKSGTAAIADNDWGIVASQDAMGPEADNDNSAVTVVRAFGLDGLLVREFIPFEGFTGGVTVATGDVNGDGVDDIICGAGPGGGPHVKVFDGVTFTAMASFFAFDVGFTGGVFVAAGDVNGSGDAEVIVGAGPGGGAHVRVFNIEGGAVTDLESFFVFNHGFTGGVRVAAGDINGDGFDDIVAAAGPGGGPHIKVFNPVGAGVTLLRSFFALDPRFEAGVFVSAADINGDGFDDILAGAGGSVDTNALVVFDAVTSKIEVALDPFPDFAGGVRVGAVDLDGDDDAEIVAGAGPTGGPHVKIYSDLDNASEIDSFFAFDLSFGGGVFVG